MESTTPHFQTACVVTRGTIQELHVGTVKRSSRRDGMLTIPLALPHSEARQANRRRHSQEHDHLKLRDDRISPAAERARQHPRLRVARNLPKQREPLLSWPLLAIRRNGLKPEVIVRVQVSVAVSRCHFDGG